MKTRQWLIVLSIILSLLLITGCQAARVNKQASSGLAPMATEAPSQAEYDRATASEGAKGGAAPVELPAADSFAAAANQQMIIRTVNITMLVDDVDRASQDIVTLVANYKGYVSSSNLWHEGERTYANITLRVPAESLDALLAELRSKAVRVDSESISTQDVSQEYVDLDSRLRNLEATEQELLQVLDNIYEKSYKAEDVLSVYRELTTIRGEIEQIKGRQQYLENLTALATVQVSLQPVATPPSVVEEGKFNPMVIINTALRNLVHILQGVYEVIIVILLNVLPVLIILAIPVVVIILIVRASKRNKARKQAPPQA